MLFKKNNFLKKNYLKEITDGFFENRFKNLGYLPRWIIICIDVAILILASFLTYLIVANLTSHHYDTFSFSIRYGIIIFVNIFCFVVFRTYAGIIRYSSFIDALRLLFSTFSALVLLSLLNFIHYKVHGVNIYLYSALVVNFIISFILLFVFRIAVKFLFENYLATSSSEKVIRVVVYGAGNNAVALANAINLESVNKYQVVGFIDKKKSRLAKEVLGVPIVQRKKGVAVILRMLKADAVILSDKNITNEEKLKIVEDCLEHNYKILTLPTVSDWNSTKEVSKSIKKFEIKDLLERQPIVLNNHKIESQIKDRVLLVTGAAGSIGSEIVHQVLVFQPAKVILIDQAETPLHHLFIELEKRNLNVQIHPIVADIKDFKLLESIFEKHKPELIYHAAAYKHVPLMEENPYQAVVTNVLGTKNVADLAVKYNVDRFVMVSTDKAVNPSNIMGASKRIAEIYVQMLNRRNTGNNPVQTKFITTRFGNVLGSNGSVVPLFTKQIENGGPVTITHPDIIRYFMTIPEACQLVLEAGTMGSGGEIYIFDMGKPVKIVDLARKMILLAGFVPDKDIQIEIVGLRPGEKLYEELLNDSAKTLPTHHDKIMISVVENEVGFEEFSQNIAKLKELSNEMNTLDMVRIMKQIVPEFKSLNSTFEQLD